MKLKTINYLIKSYFYFSPTELKGIKVLTFLVVVSFLLPKFLVYYYPIGTVDIKLIDLADDYLTEHPIHENANTFHVRNTSNLSFKDSTFSKRKLNYPIELNTADSLSIVALYRIGPALTHRIIEYRDKLGGFISLNQLTEIWGFDEDILYDLNGKIKVDKSKAKIFELNMVSLDELKTHPYFKYKLSNAIINFRQAHGDFNKLEDLKKIQLVNDSVYQKIIKYLVL